MQADSAQLVYYWSEFQKLCAHAAMLYHAETVHWQSQNPTSYQTPCQQEKPCRFALQAWCTRDISCFTPALPARGAIPSHPSRQLRQPSCMVHPAGCLPAKVMTALCISYDCWLAPTPFAPDLLSCMVSHCISNLHDFGQLPKALPHAVLH